MNNYNHLTTLLDLLTKKNVSICVKDFSGFISINKELRLALKPYYSHNNPYCMYIKSHRHSCTACLSMISKTKDKFSRACNPFFGMCHAGVSEYIIPINSNGFIVGSINIGFYPLNLHKSLQRIRRVCKDSSLNEDKAIALFHQHIHNPLINLPLLLPSLEMVADYLALTYNVMCSTHTVQKASIDSLSNEQKILTTAITYIQQNYIGPISVASLAHECYCSTSHLSHLFNKNVGVSINTYINKMRIESAKTFLENTTIGMSEIGLAVGFNDSSYFSRVFRKLVGIPPKEYRRRFYKDSPSNYSLQFK